MNEIAFPEGYPQRLKKISWTLGEIAGPHKWYNRHLPYDEKNNDWYVYSVLKDMMYQHGVKTISEELDKVLRMWMNYFTVLFIEDEGCFRLTMKKDKETNKRKEFDDVRWIEACQEAGLARKKRSFIIP